MVKIKIPKFFLEDLTLFRVFGDILLIHVKRFTQSAESAIIEENLPRGGDAQRSA